MDELSLNRFHHFAKKALTSSQCNTNTLSKIKSCVDNSLRDVPLSNGGLKEKSLKMKELKSAVINRMKYKTNEAQRDTPATPTCETPCETDNTYVNYGSRKSHSDKLKTEPQQRSAKHTLPNELVGDNAVTAERIQDLLQQQKDISHQELEEQQKEQEALGEELANLTGVLKDATLTLNRVVVDQTMALETIHTHVEENANELHAQKNQMNKRTKSASSGIMQSIATMCWVVVLFIVVYVIIRLFPQNPYFTV